MAERSGAWRVGRELLASGGMSFDEWEALDEKPAAVLALWSGIDEGEGTFEGEQQTAELWLTRDQAAQLAASLLQVAFSDGVLLGSGSGI